MIKILYANHHDSDMLYAVKNHISDPTFLIDTGKKKYLLLDRREIDVFREKSSDKLLSLQLSDPLIDHARAMKYKTTLANRLALAVLQHFVLLRKPLIVSSSFPLDMADFLRAHGAELRPQPTLYPERQIKSRQEITYISDALKKTQSAFRHIEKILRSSIVRKSRLWYKGKPLTSELLKHEIDRLLLEDNLLNVHDIIISCGKHAAVPHHPGEGQLLARQTIICDLFPRDRATGYFADMTRTYVKGTPPLKVRNMYKAVLAAQNVAFHTIRAGTSTNEVHQRVCDEFLRLGFDVGDHGFIHGTGHGLGLDIHEDPFLRPGHDQILQEGNVVTVEPGLYYPRTGGVRIEDVVVVTQSGNSNLTNYHKKYMIP